MTTPYDESRRRIERIRWKLDLLASVLNDLAARMKAITERRERTFDGLGVGGLGDGGLGDGGLGDGGLGVGGLGVGGLGRPGDDPTAELLEILRKKVARAREISRKPIRFDGSCGVPQFRFAQYVEFRNVAEFLRFRDLPPIHPEDLDRLDWPELERRLQAEADEDEGEA